MTYDTSNEKIIHVNNVDIATETFGDPSNPAILLIQGAGNSMISWKQTFCEQLAEGGHFVIRYDSRDTGRSTSYEVGHPLYTLRDLEADAIGLLDAFKIERAHVVGISQGAAITQLLAIDHPTRIASITLISGTPGGPGHTAPDLPPPTDEISKVFSGEVSPAEPNWTDRDSVARYLTEGERPFAGGGIFEEDSFLAAGRNNFDRTPNLATQLTNPFLISAGEPWRDQLQTISVSALILHGTVDPLFPFAHGEALAKEIPHAVLQPLENIGHAHLPLSVQDMVVKRILDHTK